MVELKKRAENRVIPKYGEANVDKQISPTASDHPNTNWRHCKVPLSVDGNLLKECTNYLQKIVMTMMRTAEIGFVPPMVYVQVE